MTPVAVTRISISLRRVVRAPTEACIRVAAAITVPLARNKRFPEPGRIGSLLKGREGTEREREGWGDVPSPQAPVSFLAAMALSHYAIGAAQLGPVTCCVPAGAVATRQRRSWLHC